MDRPGHGEVGALIVKNPMTVKRGELTMAHEIESIAYANETPWHGLGVRVDSSISIDDMLTAADLDWRVELRPLFTKSDTGEMIEVPNRRALVRDYDNKILTVTSPNWKPFQNRDALEFFREYTESGGAHMETAGSLREGKMIWALAKIDRDFRIKGREHDTTKGYILLSSPHEVGYSIKVRPTATRVVCANTFAIADRGAAQYSQGHSTAFRADEAKATIQLAVDHIARMEREANLLASATVSNYDAALFYSRLLQPVDLEECVTERVHVNSLLTTEADRNSAFHGVWESYLNAPGAEPGTLWGVFNGVTHWADHTAGNRGREARLTSAWFGERAVTKQKAYDALLEMVS